MSDPQKIYTHLKPPKPVNVTLFEKKKAFAVVIKDLNIRPS
jgi:hypothetical protein